MRSRRQRSRRQPRAATPASRDTSLAMSGLEVCAATYAAVRNATYLFAQTPTPAFGFSPAHLCADDALFGTRSFSIDVECVASGVGYDDRYVRAHGPMQAASRTSLGAGASALAPRVVGRISMVDEDEVVVFDSFVRPTVPVISCLTELTGIEPADLAGAPDLASVVARLREVLPRTARLVGQNIQKDIVWTGLRLGVDFESFVDLGAIFRMWAPQPNGSSKLVTFSLRHEVVNLLGEDIQAGVHDPIKDALFSIRLWNAYKHADDARLAAARDTLRLAKRTPSFASSVRRCGPARATGSLAGLLTLTCRLCSTSAGRACRIPSSMALRWRRAQAQAAERAFSPALRRRPSGKCARARASHGTRWQCAAARAARRVRGVAACAAAGAAPQRDSHKAARTFPLDLQAAVEERSPPLCSVRHHGNASRRRSRCTDLARLILARSPFTWRPMQRRPLGHLSPPRRWRTWIAVISPRSKQHCWSCVARTTSSCTR